MSTALGIPDPITAITNSMRSLQAQLESAGYPRPQVSLAGKFFKAAIALNQTGARIFVSPLGENGAGVDTKGFDSLPQAEEFVATATNAATMAAKISGRLAKLDAYALYKVLMLIEAEEYIIAQGYSR
jgi:hypothetical protein